MVEGNEHEWDELQSLLEAYEQLGHPIRDERDFVKWQALAQELLAKKSAEVSVGKQAR